MDTIIVTCVIAFWVLAMAPAVILPAVQGKRGRLDLRPGTTPGGNPIVPLGSAHDAAPTNAAA